MRGAARAITVATLALATAPAGALAQIPAPIQPAGGAAVIEGQYIVVLKDGKAAAASDRVERRARGRGGRVQRQYRRAINGFTAQLSSEALADVRRDPDVAYVEPDSVVSIERDPDGRDVGPGPHRSARPAAEPDLQLQRDGRRRQGVHHRHRHPHDARAVRRPRGDGRGRQSTAARRMTATVMARTSPAPSAASKYGVAKGVSLVAVRVLNCQGSGSTSGVIRASTG